MNQYLSFDDYIKVLGDTYKVLNINNIEFLKNKYEIYKKVFDDYKSKIINIRSRFNMELLGFKNTLTTTNIDFFINRGYSYDEAQIELNKRQNILSIKNIMKRYSLNIEDAKNKREELCNKYNRKRQETFLERYTEIEMDEINYKKGAALRYDYYLNKINPDTNKYYTIEESKKCVTIRQSRASLKRISLIKDGTISRDKFNTNIEYWFKITDNLVDAYKLLHDRQHTFSLQKCIERYGLETGTLIFNERQDKWQKTLKNKPVEERIQIELKKFRNNKSQFYSNESIKYFDIIKKILCDKSINVTFLYKESELLLHTGTQVFFYDLTIPELNIIIEYNGSHIHPSPLLTIEQREKWIHPYTKKNYYDTVERDNQKKELAIKHDYKYYEIYDYEKYEKLNYIIEEIENEFNKRKNA